ncbi:hypothetical protein ACQYRI_10790 [Salmonella enterica]
MPWRIDLTKPLENAILLKKSNQTVSKKTLDIILGKLLQIDKGLATRTQMERLDDAMRQIKSHEVFKEISGLVAKCYAVPAYEYSEMYREPDSTSQAYDTLALTATCKAVSTDHGSIINFSHFLSLLAFVKKQQDVHFQAITRLESKKDVANDTFLSVDIAKRGNDTKMVIYVSAYDEKDISGIEQSVLRAAKMFYRQSKINLHKDRLHVVSILQPASATPHQSARSAVEQALKLHTHPEPGMVQFIAGK